MGLACFLCLKVELQDYLLFKDIVMNRQNYVPLQEAVTSRMWAEVVPRKSIRGWKTPKLMQPAQQDPVRAAGGSSPHPHSPQRHLAPKHSSKSLFSLCLLLCTHLNIVCLTPSSRFSGSEHYLPPGSPAAAAPLTQLCSLPSQLF